MSSVRELISSGINALRSDNPRAAVSAAQQLATHVSASSPALSAQLMAAATAVAAKVGTVPPPPGASVKEAIMGIWKAGKLLDMPREPSPLPIERRNAWDQLNILYKAATSTSAESQPSTVTTGRNLAKNTAYVSAYNAYLQARQNYLVKYAGVSDVVPTATGPSLNPFNAPPAARPSLTSSTTAAEADEDTGALLNGPSAWGDAQLNGPSESELRETNELVSRLNAKMFSALENAPTNAQTLAALTRYLALPNPDYNELKDRVERLLIKLPDSDSLKPGYTEVRDQIQTQITEKADRLPAAVAARQAAEQSTTNAARNAARNRTAKNSGYRNSRNQQEDNDQFAELQRRIADPATDVATLEALRDIIVAKGKRFINTLLVKRYDDLERRIIPIIDKKRKDEKKEKKQANVVAKPRTQGINFVNPLVSKQRPPVPYVNPVNLAGLTADINAPVPESPADVVRRLGGQPYNATAAARAKAATAAKKEIEAAEKNREVAEAAAAAQRKIADAAAEAAAEEQADRNREERKGAIQRNLEQQLSSPPRTRFNVGAASPGQRQPSRYNAAVEPPAPLPRIFRGGPAPQQPIRNAVHAVAPNIVGTRGGPKVGGYRVSRKQRQKGRSTHKKGKRSV